MPSAASPVIGNANSRLRSAGSVACAGSVHGRKGLVSERVADHARDLQCLPVCLSSAAKESSLACNTPSSVVGI